MELKRMSFLAEIKADGDEGVIEGYGAVFGNVDNHGDIVERGAFARSLKERGLPVMLWQHDRAQPIGIYTEAAEDGNGLRLKGKINLDVERGREAYSLLKMGAIKGMSIGYKTKSYSNDKAGIRHLSDVDLYEVSLVTFPANEAASVTGVKSGELPQTERDFELFLRDAGFGRGQAKAIVAKGFRASKHEQRDADDMQEVLAGLQKALCILKGE